MGDITQDILPSQQPSKLPVRRFDHREIDGLLFALRGIAAPYLGISIQLSAKGDVEALAFSTANEALYLTLQGFVRGGTDANSSPQDITTKITTELSKVLAGFQMARIALHLHRHLHWHVAGVDLSTLLVSGRDRAQYPSDFVEKKIESTFDRQKMDYLWYPGTDDEDPKRRTCLRAWISAICADADERAMQSAAQVDTNRVDIKYLSCLEDMVLCAELLENLKSTSVEGEIKDIVADGENWQVENARYRNRIRTSSQTSIELRTESGPSVFGRAIATRGRSTSIGLTQGRFPSNTSSIVGITVHGREEPTAAERAQNEFVLRILQGAIELTGRLFIELIWYPQDGATPANRPTHPPPPDTDAFSELNQSQKEVVAAMLSPSQPIVIVHGPPGTGKTSTIAAAAAHWVSEGTPVWIIAQSNVGVKNITRSLVKKGISDFRLIVSKEFHEEWHEHLYTSIRDKVILSNELSQNAFGIVEPRLRGSKIILCTLSMLSSPVLDQCRVFKIAPMVRLVVDEASQINVFEYMHLFHKFKELEKVCFFGDPKQLPPFGQDKVPQLQSIFNIKHLKPTAYFLNTQYRMPVPLGEFISREVYNSKLLSSHSVRDSSCIALIDVSKGTEASAGKSWTNAEEVRIVVKLVQDYYRYKDYCIITPYDAQRAAIVKSLETAGLPSDKVFNVDSFQGHEAEYVIVSVTRTVELGFLAQDHRINVMLTRCRSGMAIVSNQSFVSDRGHQTLVGKLVTHWKSLKPSDSVWIDWRRVAEGGVDLPGARALHPGLPEAVTDATHSLTRKQSRSSPLLVPALSRPASQSSLRSFTALEPQPVPDASDFPELPNSAPAAERPRQQSASVWRQKLTQAFRGRTR